MNKRTFGIVIGIVVLLLASLACGESGSSFKKTPALDLTTNYLQDQRDTAYQYRDVFEDMAQGRYDDAPRRLLALGKKVRGLHPPAQYRDVHTEYMQATYCFDGVAHALESGDISSALRYLQEGNGHVDKATTLMNSK
ncbi:hypothetical protein KKE60_04140 [Patescibacteria group bacterium]|nr:hypothetical protein [Patescibacteria group bacterium]